MSAYFPHLQALRGVAVLGPVVLHLWPATVPASDLTPRVTGLGYLGVELFFVISGFLITTILLDARDQVDSRGPAAAGGARRGILKAFYARRALRILPVYWLTLAVLGAAGIGTVREFFGWNWAFLGNVMMTARQIFPADTSHLWSLAVEEQFYLAWPLLLLFVPRRHLLPTMVALACFAPLFRWVCLAYFSPWHATLLMPACLDVLGLGGILAWLFRERDVKPERYRAFTRFAALAGAAGSALHVAWYLKSDSAWITAWPLARTSYALLFTAVVARGAEGFAGAAGRLAGWRPLVHLGTVSYAVYLFHPFAPELLALVAPVPWLGSLHPVALFGVQVAATIAAATVSWRVLERPVNARRHHFPYVLASARGAP